MLPSTSWEFVEERDIVGLIRAHSLCEDAASNHILLNVDHLEGAVGTPLPVDLVTVDLQPRRVVLASDPQTD